jgi:hypothetical protein
MIELGWETILHGRGGIDRQQSKITAQHAQRG